MKKDFTVQFQPVGTAMWLDITECIEKEWAFELLADFERPPFKGKYRVFNRDTFEEVKATPVVPPFPKDRIGTTRG